MCLYTSLSHTHSLCHSHSHSRTHTNSQFGRAKPILQECSRIMEETLGATHEYTMTCKNNLAGLLFAMGDNEEALEMYESCLKRAQYKLKRIQEFCRQSESSSPESNSKSIKDSEETVGIKNNIAVLLKKMNRPKMSDVSVFGLCLAICNFIVYPLRLCK